jgi:hypothetical protein
MFHSFRAFIRSIIPWKGKSMTDPAPKPEGERPLDKHAKTVNTSESTTRAGGGYTTVNDAEPSLDGFKEQTSTYDKARTEVLRYHAFCALMVKLWRCLTNEKGADPNTATIAGIALYLSDYKALRALDASELHLYADTFRTYVTSSIWLSTVDGKPVARPGCRPAAKAMFKSIGQTIDELAYSSMSSSRMDRLLIDMVTAVDDWVHIAHPSLVLS